MNQDIATLLNPIIPKRASDSIANQIKELVYSGMLKPGDRLPSERDLATRFNTGRMTVREALRILEESGFIKIKQGVDGGTFVKELDGAEMTKSISDLIKVGTISLQELTEARIAIESLILESVIQSVTPDQLLLLKKNIENCVSTNENNPADPKGSSQRLIHFHLLLGSFAQNGLLRFLHQSMVDLSNKFVDQYAPHSFNLEDHINQHKAIFDAIQSKNRLKSIDALKEHLMAVSEHLDAEMKTEKSS